VSGSKKRGFRVTFRTPDGSLIMDRESDREFYIRGSGVDLEFVALVLKKDSAEKGVRVLSHKVTDEGLIAVVDWISTR
jgi:hypothetical protein